MYLSSEWQWWQMNVNQTSMSEVWRPDEQLRQAMCHFELFPTTIYKCSLVTFLTKQYMKKKCITQQCDNSLWKFSAHIVVATMTFCRWKNKNSSCNWHWRLPRSILPTKTNFLHLGLNCNVITVIPYLSTDKSQINWMCNFGLGFWKNWRFHRISRNFRSNSWFLPSHGCEFPSARMVLNSNKLRREIVALRMPSAHYRIPSLNPLTY